ncbi:MAG TPA: DUF1501 domain-containing protein [Bryobacteraceae bacterium]|jgi:uncharacterized protein (DUF1501 family)|nr:DUF1501 domain-containing protein [Bryobacteraceae bacterium]
MFSRRRFVKIGAASVGSLALRPLGLLPALAQSSSPEYRALVCVFLFGGNDSNNMVIPTDATNFAAYTQIRSNLALTAAQLTGNVTAKSSGAPYAFHGMMPEMASLFSNGELAVVANVGPLVQPITRDQYVANSSPIPVNLFSHSDQQMEWQTSAPGQNSATGWGGRVADLIASQNSSTFPPFLSLAGNTIMGSGTQTQPVALSPGGSLSLQGFNSSASSQARYQLLKQLLTTETGLALVQAANGKVASSISDATALGSALSKSTALKTTFPTTSLGAQLKQVAEIIQVRADLGMNRQIFFASLGGFDTHTGELNTHNSLYPQVSQALAAFNSAMQELGVANNVTAFTESDFNRTFQPTSGNGSDHAWGSHHLVMGGAVSGGDVYGQFPAFQLGGPNDTDTRGRWIPTTAIDQYGATLSSWFGLSSAQLASVFPNFVNFGSAKLGFLG